MSIDEVSEDELIPLVEPDENDPRIQAAVAELRDLIAQRWPEATFSVYHGDDPNGIYLKAVVDVDDLGDVVDVVLDRLTDFGEQGLPVYVVPDWPIERLREQLRQQAQAREARPAAVAT